MKGGAFKGGEGPSVSKSVGRDGNGSSVSFIFSSITSHIFGDGKSICGSPMSLLVLREMIKKKLRQFPKGGAVVEKP